MKKHCALIICLALVGVVAFYPSAEANERISPEVALGIARDTPEVQAFLKIYRQYNLEKRYPQCRLDPQVMKPCDSDWVNCVEDGWVVKYTVAATCGVPEAERLGVTLLIQASTGKVLSRYPETVYFENKNYCLADNDCMAISGSGVKFLGRCENFSHAPFAFGGAYFSSELCRCVNDQCVPLTNKPNPE